MASSRIEELPDNFNEAVTLKSSQEKSGAPPAAPVSTETKEESSKLNVAPTATLPPAMAQAQAQTADEVLALMNKMPLFMTNLDDLEDGEENIQLEAIKAMAYEGTKSEIAGNFREQGNELAKQKQWVDAREFYNKALDTLRMSDKQLQEVKGGDGPSDFEVLDVDEAEEERKRVQIKEACLVNRALCNLEKKNYGACNRDCAATLKMNPRNVKAWYRSATACLALDRIDEAEDACNRGLAVEASNAALKTLSAKIAARKNYLLEQEQARQARAERKRNEQVALQHALKSRNISTRTTKAAPDLEDAAIDLEDPLNPASTLRIPVILLYPLHNQSDFIKQFAESESIGQHLQYIFPLPWDERGQYTPESVDCFVETPAGGLIKAGKKMSLLRILSTGKIEVVNQLLHIHIVPASQTQDWIAEYKRKNAR